MLVEQPLFVCFLCRTYLTHDPVVIAARRLVREVLETNLLAWSKTEQCVQSIR